MRLLTAMDGHGWSKGEVGESTSGTGTRSTTIKGGVGSHIRSGNHGHPANGSGHIQVEQSFEMRSLPIGSSRTTGMEADRGDEDDKISRDGSEPEHVLFHLSEQFQHLTPCPF